MIGIIRRGFVQLVTGSGMASRVAVAKDGLQRNSAALQWLPSSPEVEQQFDNKLAIASRNKRLIPDAQTVDIALAIIKGLRGESFQRPEHLDF